MILCIENGNKTKDKKKGLILPVRVIACGVFRPVLDYFHFQKRYPHVNLTFLPSSLHLYPNELRRLLLWESTKAQQNGEAVICLYGNCFPDINDFCENHGIIKIPGHSCYEILLGSRRFQKIMDETPGTYFLERELIVNFEEYCVKPMELFDEELRRLCFKNYVKVIYVRQPDDLDIILKAYSIARFLNLSLEIEDADYSFLEQSLEGLIQNGQEKKN